MNNEKITDTTIDEFIEEIGEYNPTMKLNPTEDTDLPFKECEMMIGELRLLDTINGRKVILTLEDPDSEDKFDIFVNKTSLALLKQKHGNKISSWKKKKVKITKTKDPKFHKDMILVTPL